MHSALRVYVRSLIGAVFVVPCLGASASPPEPPGPLKSGSLRLPSGFVENQGQWAPHIRFAAEHGALTAGARDDGLEIHLAGEMLPSLLLTFENARPGARPEGEGDANGCYHFYAGSDPARWRSHVSAYASVLYKALYPGVDLRVREEGGRLEYDLILAPHADLDSVVMRCEGVSDLEMQADGALLLHTGDGPLHQTPPRTWELLPDGGIRPVGCRFRVLDGERFGFDVPDRRPERGLVIDPGLEWSTYLAGDGTCVVTAVEAAPDGSGDVYVAGDTSSTSFPFAAGNIFPPGEKMFVARVNATGAGVVWAAFIGGTNGILGRQFNWGALAVDDLGGAAIAGDTELLDHPTTPGAFDRDYAGGIDAWVARFDAGGALVFSTFLGGAGYDSAQAVGFDPSGAVIVACQTYSSDYPTTVGAYDRTYNAPTSEPATGAHGDVGITRFGPTGQMTYSTFLGGQGFEIVEDMAVDPLGFVMVTGWLGGTTETPYPTTPGAFDTTWNGSYDAFLGRLKLDGAGTADLKYSTFLGSTGEDRVLAVTVDPNNPELVALGGWTWSANFPTTPGVFKPSSGVAQDSLIRQTVVANFRFPAAGGGSLVWSTYFGGNVREGGANDVAITDLGDVVFAGFTGDYEMPTTRGAYDRLLGGDDHYVARLNATGSTLQYSSYLGGLGGEEHLSAGPQVAYLGGNTVVIGGMTGSRDFPTTAGVMDTVHDDGVILASTWAPSSDGYLARISLENDASGDLSVNAPALAHPPNAAQYPDGGSSRVYFDWSDVADASGIDGYQIEVSSRTDFATGFVQFRYSTRESKVLIPPIGGPEQGLARITWFWRVKTADRAGNLSAWSPTSSFAIGVSGAPAAMHFAGAYPTNVVQNGTTAGTVWLTDFAPPGGAVVTLESDNPNYITVPSTVTVTAGTKVAPFTVTVNPSNLPVWQDLGTSANIIATYGLSAYATAGASPPPANVTVATIIPDPWEVTGGNPSSGLVQLSNPAGAGGAVVELLSSNPAYASVPPSVTVPAGATSVEFPITTSPVTLPVFVTLGARRGPFGDAASLVGARYVFFYVNPEPLVSLTSMSISPSSVSAGTNPTATLTLSGPAPEDFGGALVRLTSSNPAVAVTANSLDFLPGESSKTFGIGTRNVSTPTTVTIFASYDAGEVSANITVNPIPPVPLSSITFNTNPVAAGRSSIMFVCLSAAAPPGGQVVTLSSSNPAVVSVPPNVTITDSMTCVYPDAVTHPPVTAPTTVTITGSSGGATRTATLTVNPDPALASVTLNPAAVSSGATSVGTVTFTAGTNTGGATVTLSSSHPTVASVPASVYIPVANTTAEFLISVAAGAPATSVTITATHGTTTRTAALSVGGGGGGGGEGWLSPTANAADSGGDGNGFESNPANAHADDALNAVDNNGGTNSSTSCTSTSRDKHRFFNYALGVPAGSTIQGIEVRLDARVDSTSGTPKMCVQLSWNGGASWTATQSTPNLTTSMATYLLGGATNTWGRTWTSAELSDANFRVRVINVASSTSRDFSLDWIPVRVTFQAGTPDTTPPTVSITAPSGGATVSGTTTISATASDNVGVTRVDFLVDGVLMSSDTTSPYSASWNTTTATNGTHALTARAFDAANNQTTSAAVSVTVNNAPPSDATPPTVSITSPAAGMTLSGTVTISASASDNVGVTRVEFLVDGALLSSDTTSPYSASWNTTTATNGAHSLTARAFDAANNQATSAAVNVTVSNGSAPVLDITLSGVPASVQERDEFTATATVTNTGGASASGYSVLIGFNPSFSMSRRSPSNSSQSLPTVPAGGSQSVSWLVRAENQGSATLTMTLRNSSGQTVDTVSRTITITD